VEGNGGMKYDEEEGNEGVYQHFLKSN